MRDSYEKSRKWRKANEVSEDKEKESSAQCSQDLSNAHAIYFANNGELGELGDALDTAAVWKLGQ